MVFILQPDRLLLKRQVSSLAPSIKGRVLDAGAGMHDRYSHLFKTEDYIKMDVTAGPNVDVVGSAEQIPFPDNHFDSVVSTQVLEHLPHPWLATREFGRVLKPGGVLLLTIPQMNELHEEPYDFFRYTKYGLISLLTEAGFTILTLEPRGGFYATVTQQLVRYITDRFSLYERPLVGKIIGKLLSWLSQGAVWLDDHTNNPANAKHTIGWALLAKKL